MDRIGDGQRLSVDVDEVKLYGGPGRTMAFHEIKAGRLKARKMGSRTVVLMEDLAAYLRDLPVVGQ